MGLGFTDFLRLVLPRGQKYPPTLLGSVQPVAIMADLRQLVSGPFGARYSEGFNSAGVLNEYVTIQLLVRSPGGAIITNMAAQQTGSVKYPIFDGTDGLDTAGAGVIAQTPDPHCPDEFPDGPQCVLGFGTTPTVFGVTSGATTRSIGPFFVSAGRRVTMQSAALTNGGSYFIEWVELQAPKELF